MNPLSKLVKRDRSAGFTAVELIATLLILGILAAFVIPKADSEDSKMLNDMNVLRAHIRFAQLRAMGDDGTWGLNIAGSGKSYTLERNGTTSAMVNLPGEDSATYDFQSTALSVTPGRIEFDDRGRPVGPSETPLTTDTTITPTVSGEHGSVKPIIITQQTGFIK
ncbi:Tfp pilus assembly protein FimT/FimU [Oceanidesulfovibrio marinus]|nr:prepilin-type N-terminal cleavage/methylation domain-containing protein [Oceanidesulfovibrio marinus]